MKAKEMTFRPRWGRPIQAKGQRNVVLYHDVLPFDFAESHVTGSDLKVDLKYGQVGPFWITLMARKQASVPDVTFRFPV